VLHLAGEHDLSTVSALADAFSHAVAAGSNDVLIDLSEVTFMDASTISALMRLRDRLAEASRTLTIHEPAAACVRRLVEICCGPLGLSEPDRAR